MASSGLPCLSRHTPDQIGSRQTDWFDWHIRGVCLLRQGSAEEAIEVFETGMRNCRLASDRRYFQTSLAIAQIHAKRAGDAAKTLENEHGEVGDVIRIHAFGELDDADQVSQAYTVTGGSVTSSTEYIIW